MAAARQAPDSGHPLARTDEDWRPCCTDRGRRHDGRRALLARDVIQALQAGAPQAGVPQAGVPHCHRRRHGRPHTTQHTPPVATTAAVVAAGQDAELCRHQAAQHREVQSPKEVPSNFLRH